MFTRLRQRVAVMLRTCTRNPARYGARPGCVLVQNAIRSCTFFAIKSGSLCWQRQLRTDTSCSFRMNHALPGAISSHWAGSQHHNATVRRSRAFPSMQQLQNAIINSAFYQAGQGTAWFRTKCRANNAPLSPIPWLARAALLFPRRTAVRYGDHVTWTYSELMKKARMLGSAILKSGVRRGDVVSVMIPNVPLGVVCHFAVPGSGSTLHMINIRLDARAVAFQLEHAESKLLIVDCELAATAKAALEMMEERHRPRLIEAQDPLHPRWREEGESLDAFLSTGDSEFELREPDDEDEAIALSYTSGTTGNPKGVLTHHRGATLNSLSLSLTWPLVGDRIVYLWTLPMFHCNGWCFPWSVTAVGGTHVCLRYVRAEDVLNALARERVTHFCGAPVIMNLLLGASEDDKAALKQQVLDKQSGAMIRMLTAGSAPPPSVMHQMESELGIQPLASYGLTEVYGPATACLWESSWDDLDEDEKDRRMPWQAPSLVHDMYVAKRRGLEAVPADGVTLGEVLLRGNGVMKEYLKNEQATKEAFDQGRWFRTGDLAVQHADGRVELKDRAKDIIISGGENISSIEVETALHQHEAVLHVAVVAVEDEFWGEVPVAVVEAKEGVPVTGEDILKHARRTLAGFKCPRKVILRELPKTATGKIQKHVLRAEIMAAEAAVTEEGQKS